MLRTNCSSDRNPIKRLEIERFKGYRTMWVEEEVVDESEDVEHRNRMIRSNENAQSLAHLHTFHLIGQWKVNHIKSHGPGDYQNLHIPRKKKISTSQSSTAAKKWKCRSMTRKSAILREMLQWTDKSIDSLSCRQRMLKVLVKNFKKFLKEIPKKN